MQPKKTTITTSKRIILHSLVMICYRFSLLVISVFFVYSVKVETAQLECSSQDIRLIGPSDVEVSYVEGVNEVNSINETSFFFEEPLLARRIQLSINDAVTGDSGIYYWKMNLFGCPEVNATQVFEPMETSCECPEPTVIPIISHSQTLSYTSRTSTCIIQGSIKEVFITVTSVVTTSIVTTSTVTTSTVTASTVSTSTVAISTVTTSTVTTSTVTTSTVTTSTLTTSTVTTSTVTTSPVTTTVMETPEDNNCQEELIAAIIVPVVTEQILIILIITILIVCVTRKGKRFNHKTGHDLQTLESPLNLLTEDQTDNQLEIIPSDQISEYDYADINEMKNNPVCVEVIEGDGGHQLQDNPAYMKGLSGDGGYQVEDNPAYVKGLSGDGGYQVEDNPSYMKGLTEELAGDGGYQLEDNPAYTKGLSGDGE